MVSVLLAWSAVIAWDMVRALHWKALRWTQVSAALPTSVLEALFKSNKKQLRKGFKTWIWALRFWFEVWFNSLLGPNLTISSESWLPVSARPPDTCVTSFISSNILWELSETSMQSQRHCLLCVFPGPEQRRASLGSQVWRMVQLTCEISSPLSCG